MKMIRDMERVSAKLMMRFTLDNSKTISKMERDSIFMGMVMPRWANGWMRKKLELGISFIKIQVAQSISGKGSGSMTKSST